MYLKNIATTVEDERQESLAALRVFQSIDQECKILHVEKYLLQNSMAEVIRNALFKCNRDLVPHI